MATKRAADPTVVGSIQALGTMLGDMVEVIVEAEAIASKGDQNSAMLLLERVESRLQDAIALHRGILVLHRQR